MTDIRDLIWQARNRRAFRNPTPAMPIAPFGGSSPTMPNNIAPLREGMPNLSQTAKTPEPTLSPSEQKLKQMFTGQTGDLGNGISSGDMTDTNQPTTTAPVGKTLTYGEQLLKKTLEDRQAIQSRSLVDDDTKLSNFGSGAANAMRQMQRTGDSQADLGMTLGLGIGGGLRGLFTKNEDEKRQQQQDLNKNDSEYKNARQIRDDEVGEDYKKAQAANVLDKPVLEREKLEAGIKKDNARAQARTDAINQQADIRSGEAKIFVDSSGKQWKQYLKADSTGKIREMEPIINPQTQEQEYAPGEQMVDWRDPQTGNTIQVKAKQVLMPGATLATGNANREQQATVTNATKQLEVEKENVQNQLTYQAQVNNVLSTLATNDASLSALGGNVTGLRSQMDAKLGEARTLLDSINSEFNIDPENATDDQIKRANAGKKAAQSRYNSLADDFNKLNGQLYEELGKTEAGKVKADQLQKLMPKAPPKLSFTPIEATKVSGGVSNDGKAPTFTESQARAYYTSKGKSESEINNLIQKGKTQKIIN